MDKKGSPEVRRVCSFEILEKSGGARFCAACCWRPCCIGSRGTYSPVSRPSIDPVLSLTLTADGAQDVLRRYDKFLEKLVKLDLLEANSIKPILDVGS